MKMSYFRYIFLGFASILAISSVSFANATPPDPFPGTTLSVTSSPSYPNGAPLNTNVTYTLHVNFTSAAWSNSNGNGVHQGGKCVWAIKNSSGGGVNQTITNPNTQTDCDISFADKFTSQSAVATYQVTISNSFSQSIVLSGSVKPQASGSNSAPSPKAVYLINGVKAGSSEPVVPNGASLHLVVDGSASTDPNGWTTPGTGVSQGGSCVLYRGSSVYQTVQNPASPDDCKFDLGTVTVNSGNATQFSFWLNVIDAAGARGSSSVSVGVIIHRPGAIVSVTGVGVTQNGYQNNGTAISVPKGVPTQLYGDGSQSWSPSLTSTYLYAQNNGINAWNDPVMGISNGGSCAWNTSLSSSASYDRVISSPKDPSACGKGIDLGIHTFQTSGTYPLLKITDNTGMVSYASVQINPVTPPVNKPPVAVAKVSVDGSVLNTSAVVPRGTPVHIVINGASSTDPDGWTTATTGVSQGGKCEINTALSKAIPTPYAKTITNPATAATCTVDLGMLTFNDAPGTYTYNVLRVTDASAGASPEAQITINVVASDPTNKPPVAVAQVKADSSLYGPEQAVTKGVPTHIYLGADTSTDPNGWTTPTTGVSQGGKCEWNKDLNTGTATFEKVILNPASPVSCNIDLGMLTFNDAPGRYIYPVLRITDASGAVSNIASITIVVLDKNANLAPVAVAKFSLNNAPPEPHIYVSRGVPVRIGLDASASYDPNGWTTSLTGMSQGGKCFWNTNLDQSRPVPFVKTISNPVSSSSCNVDLGTLTFNDPPGTYTYVLLKLTDASGLQSLVAYANTATHGLLSRLLPSAYAQSADGSAMVTVIDGPTPSPTTSVEPSPTPSCNPFGYNPNCPPPTPTPDPTPCVAGQVCDTPTPSPSPTPCVSGEACDTPTPTPTPSPTPTICDPLDVACIVTNTVPTDSVLGGVDAIKDGITNAIAKILNVDPSVIAKAIAEKAKAITSSLAAAALALSTPFLASNILPNIAQWGRFLGSFFTVHKRKDRWGIVVDSDLGKPVAQAVVQVFDAEFNQLKETQVTGNDGQFGFLLPVGKYYIVASESGFVFPARKKPPVTLRDGERVYLGEEFEITDQDPEKIPHLVVPMDREETAPVGNTALRRYWDQLIEFVDRVGFVFLFIGGAINTYLLLLVPGKLNIVFEVLYLLLFILKLYILLSHQRGIGSVVDRGSRKMLDLSIIRLYDAKTNRIVQTKVTNKNGRFFILAPKGEYTASVSKPGYKTLLINKLHIKSNSSKALALDFALEPVK
ncbi:MAG: carboxypeptidase-like regulatory domain-containing protein [Candidatus Andersenbacteria bacterium]|nr:carboxypeptidase-like regulatory domain-containing protein [Candidatus Andersenbacteria bacterium]